MAQNFPVFPATLGPKQTRLYTKHTTREDLSDLKNQTPDVKRRKLQIKGQIERPKGVSKQQHAHFMSGSL